MGTAIKIILGLLLCLALIMTGALIFFIATGEQSPYLRGFVTESGDGKTYLKIVDDNGGACGDMYVDGKLWKHGINKPGPISPGTHTVNCGGPREGDIGFVIPENMIFSFDYWGP